jgi:hypothetical protein
VSWPLFIYSFFYLFVLYLMTLFQKLRLYSVEWKCDKWMVNWKGFGWKWFSCNFKWTMQKQNLIKMSTSVKRDRSTDTVSLSFLKIIKKEAKRRFLFLLQPERTGTSSGMTMKKEHTSSTTTLRNTLQNTQCSNNATNSTYDCYNQHEELFVQ